MTHRSKHYLGVTRKSFVFLWLTVWVTSAFPMCKSEDPSDLTTGILTTSGDFAIDILAPAVPTTPDIFIPPVVLNPPVVLPPPDILIPPDDTVILSVVDAGPPLASAVQQDGKIVIIRSVLFQSDSGLSTDLDYGLARFNPDGSLDQSFGTDGKTSAPISILSVRDDIPTDLAIQSDGKIIVVGSESRGDGYKDFGVARFNPDGSIDTISRIAFNQTVDQNGSPSGLDIATGIVIQQDGKIVVIGSIEVNDGGSEFGVLHLNSDGNLDQSFGCEGRSRTAFDRGNAISGSPTDVVLQADGKIIVVGSIELVNGDRDFGILRLNANGSPDNTFGVDGRSLVAFNRGGNDIDSPTAVAVQADGKIIVVGSVDFGTGNQDFGVVRLNSDGSLDSSFGIGGGITIPFDLGGVNADNPSDVVLQADGKIIVTGSVDLDAGNQDYAVVRLNTNGSVDTSFGGGPFNVAFDEGGSNVDLATNVFVKDDGVIMLVGSVDNNDSVQNTGIAFLNSSGSLIEKITGIPGLNLETKESPDSTPADPPPNPRIPRNSQTEDTPTFEIPTEMPPVPRPPPSTPAPPPAPPPSPPAPAPLPSDVCSLDADRDANVDALTDGLLFIRHMFGIQGTSLVREALATNCTQCTAADIEAFLDQCAATGASDIDGNGTIDALTDGFLIIKYMLGIRGIALTNSSVGNGCIRCSAVEIETYLQSQAVGGL